MANVRFPSKQTWHLVRLAWKFLVPVSSPTSCRHGVEHHSEHCLEGGLETSYIFKTIERIRTITKCPSYSSSIQNCKLNQPSYSSSIQFQLLSILQRHPTYSSYSTYSSSIQNCKLNQPTRVLPYNCKINQNTNQSSTISPSYSSHMELLI